jgi:mycothiol synthase
VHAALTGNPKVDRVYVVVQGSNLLATASARLDQVAFPGSGYVHWVGCANASRRKGLGRAVCGAVLARFAETGCKDAVLETDDDRLPAIGLYLALGFVPEPRHAGDAERWKHVRQQLDAAEKET